MQPIATSRLILRRFHRDDAAAMQAVLCDPEVMRFSLEGPLSSDAVEPWVLAQADHQQTARGLGRRAVVVRATGTVAGYAGLGEGWAPRGPGEAELSYRLARPCWGRGFATEAAAALLEYGLSTLGLPRVVAMVDPGNTMSVQILTKIGMAYERPVMLEGYDHPDHLYAISRSDL